MALLVLGIAALGALGDAEGEVVKLGDVELEEEAEAEVVTHTVAVVGNGPLSREQYKRIQTIPDVWMFNDMKNYVDGDRLTTWIIREAGDIPGTVLGPPIFSRPDQSDPNPPPMNYDYHQWKFEHKNLRRILVVGNTNTIPNGIKAMHPGATEVDFVPVYESASKNKTSSEDAVTFGGCAHYPHKSTGCGPSTGTLALDHLFGLRAAGKVPSDTWIHVYGMNWVFHELFLKCCNAELTTRAESCCNECHNFNKEAEIIAKCCTAANQCQVYPLYFVLGVWCLVHRPTNSPTIVIVPWYLVHRPTNSPTTESYCYCTLGTWYEFLL
jgi:hypothetical protein